MKSVRGENCRILQGGKFIQFVIILWIDQSGKVIILKIEQSGIVIVLRIEQSYLVTVYKLETENLVYLVTVCLTVWRQNSCHTGNKSFKQKSQIFTNLMLDGNVES